MSELTKQLKNRYKQMKPEMGVFALLCKPTGKAYLAVSGNIKADINSLTFQLRLGSYFPCGNLQADWTKFGESSFEISVLETLKYDDDKTKTDYTADLKLLRDLVAERFKPCEYIL